LKNELFSGSRTSERRRHPGAALTKIKVPALTNAISSACHPTRSLRPFAPTSGAHEARQDAPAPRRLAEIMVFYCSRCKQVETKPQAQTAAWG